MDLITDFIVCKILLGFLFCDDRELLTLNLLLFFSLWKMIYQQN